MKQALFGFAKSGLLAPFRAVANRIDAQRHANNAFGPAHLIDPFGSQQHVSPRQPIACVDDEVAQRPRLRIEEEVVSSFVCDLVDVGGIHAIASSVGHSQTSSRCHSSERQRGCVRWPRYCHRSHQTIPHGRETQCTTCATRLSNRQNGGGLHLTIYIATNVHPFHHDPKRVVFNVNMRRG